MNLFTMIVATVGIVFLTRMAIKIVEIKQGENSSKDFEKFDSRLKRLESRIENIETILTSKKYRLDQAFDELKQDTSS